MYPFWGLTVNFHHEHCIVPTICPWVSEDAENEEPFHLKTIKPIIRVEMIIVAFLYEVATVDVLTDYVNDANLVETQTAGFARLLNRLVLRE